MTPNGLPLAATAVRLLEKVEEQAAGVLYVARSERRAALLAGMLAGLAPALRVALVPAWDCVPYDRAGPSRDAMAARICALRQLAGDGAGGSVLIATPEALAQRVPPRSLWPTAELTLRVGAELRPDEIKQFLLRTGYVLDERVDEVGEAALRGEVVDLFPSGAADPLRLDHEDGRITGIRRYDAGTQRTRDDAEEIVLTPVSEVVFPADPEGEAVERFAGIEHFLPEFSPPLETLFDYLPDAAILVEEGVEDAFQRFREQIEDAYETRVAVPRPNGDRAPLPPSALYLDAAEWRERIGALSRIELSVAGIERAPRFARERQPAEAFGDFLAEAIDAERTLILAAGGAADRRAMAGRARRAVEVAPRLVKSWDDARAADPGSLLTLAADLDHGFLDLEHNVAVVAAQDLLGRRSGGLAEQVGHPEAALGEVELRPGDLVVHIDHGVAILKGIETVAPPGGPEGDALVLEFAGDAKLLAPAEESGRIWRYGAASDEVSLDRLGGNSWAKRREQLERDLAEQATRLVALAAAREAARVGPLVPPREAYERFAAGFRYAETADQAHAIDAVLDDLASGRPMNRLVCGDVGFGKTEVALRAAAAAALAGRQVAVVAPTTVLVRQHVQTFRRRFAGFGLEVAHLSRLVGTAEARSVKQGLASGDTPVVIGTQALAGKGISFKDLGLLIIDEEQRFGAKQKEALRALSDGVHVLTLTATPIPRTLQSALLGLQELSLITTPPARRQPVRTFLIPFDPVTVRAALLRERRRAGQSFVVCPRIEDIEPMAARLRELVPELQVVVAHGRMPADHLDGAMVDFADGVGDVLLATNIIESGLDVPRANTMLIWRADRFGLAQLHQLRGRVGRGRARGTAYLLTEPERTLGKATEQRLRTLEAFDRLGAGFAISSRDLDLRGAGDLVGEEQAGHVKLIGLALYQEMLGRALAAARGEPAEPDWTPAIHLGLSAYIPEDYIPEPEIRIATHLRLARPGPEDDAASLAEEIGDRFGPLPEPVENLLALGEIRAEARRLGVEKLDVGPEAVAASFREGAAVETVRRLDPAVAAVMEWRGERLIWTKATETAEGRRNAARAFLKAVGGARPRKRVRQREPEPAPAG